MHRILPHVEQRFVKVDANTKAGKNSKHDLFHFVLFFCPADDLLNLLQRDPSLPTMVFCNTVPSCDWTGRYLESKGINVIKLHGGLPSSVSAWLVTTASYLFSRLERSY